MWEFCFVINGKRHCFRIPMLIEKFHVPVPENFPELELAIAVLQLVKTTPSSGVKTSLAKQLTEVATSFIQDVQKGLPTGVELKQERAG